VIGELRDHSLITPVGQDTVAVHRLVQAATRDQLGSRSYDWADRAQELLVAAMPEPPITAVSLATWNLMRTHADTLIDHLPSEDPPRCPLARCGVLDRADG
jgi:hypothetical protein